MASAPTDANLRIALTLLQFIALALPAIYIFLQLVDSMGGSASIEEVNKYHIARSSVITLIIASLLLLFSIGSNIQDSPFPVIVSQSIEAWVLGIAVVLTGLGAAQFGFSVLVRRFRVERGGTTIRKSYSRTFGDLKEKYSESDDSEP